MFIGGFGREEMMNETDLCAPRSLAVSRWRSGRAPAMFQHNVSVVQSHGVRQGVMRVLGLGVDKKCAFVFQRMLEECAIQVEPCTGLQSVVERVMQRRHQFDIVLINGNYQRAEESKLLRDVCTNMDIPVIVMSGGGMVAMLIRGRVHRVLEPYIRAVLWGLWQDVVRNRISMSADLERAQNPENGIQQQQQKPWEYFANKASRAEVNLKSPSKSKTKSTDHNTREQDAVSPVKKQRVSWTPKLHREFLRAIASLGGLEKAVPNKIKEVMNVPGLTREHIASHLQKYRLSVKKREEGRHGATAGRMSQPGQPQVISQESQWKMNTGTWNQQQQQMIDQNERQQPLPSFPDPNVNVQVAPPLQSTEPDVTGSAGRLFPSDGAVAEMPFTGGNGPTEARIEGSYDPIPHIPSQSDLLASSQPEFRTEEPASIDDFWDFLDWELPNSDVQFHGIQLEDIASYQPDENTGPNTRTVSNAEGSVPLVDNPAGPATTVPGTNMQCMPHDYFKMQDLDMFFPEDQQHGGGTAGFGIHDGGHGSDYGSCS